MPRQARLDAPGALHHVIIKGIRGRKIVNNDQDRGNFVSRLGDVATETGTSIYAWALMDDHAHILMRSGSSGLSRFVKRLLTGYAIYYNRRHRRHGRLFQDRYKSIVCEEKPYLKELARYIHLNPLRAGLVDSLARLDRYRWCGHSVLMGRIKKGWQDRDYLLKRFGATESEAKRAYRQFVKKGVDQGYRPDLIGGGLIRSRGGWSEVKAMRRRGIRQDSDERILGSGKFVRRFLQQSAKFKKKKLSAEKGLKRALLLIDKTCKKEGVSVEALKGGNRRHEVSKVRAELAEKLVEDFGLSLIETGRQLGVSGSAISVILRRRDKKKDVR
jgi:REP element-mobilizing transposase RayT